MSDRDGSTLTTGRDRAAAQEARAAARDRTRTLAFAFVMFLGSVIPIPTGSSGGGGGALGGIIDALPAGVGLTDPFHLVGYAVLAALLVRATRGRRLGIVVAVIGATAFGFGIELVQAPIPWRSFAWGDAAVNAIGAVVGAAIAGVSVPAD